MKSAAPPSAQSVESPRASSQHDEIERLYGEIRNELAANNLPPPPDPACGACTGAADMAVEAGVTPLKANDNPSATCKPGASEACHDSCTLSDSICGNAEKICTIAKQLGDHDDFANDKCAHGAEACTQSQKRCCSCM